MLYPINFIKEIEPEESTYTYVYIDLVHRCNMECNNCYLPNRNYPDVDYNKLVEFIGKFKYRSEFRLIGGEPTLYNNLIAVIKFITEHPLRHRVTLVSNGLKLASFSFVNKLKNAGLSNVYLSMNGFDDDTIYEKIDDMKCAKLKIKAMENCIKLKINFTIGFIVVKDTNEFIIDKMINYFQEKQMRCFFEFRNIGSIGRNMLSAEQANYSNSELIQLLAAKFKFDKDKFIVNDEYSKVFTTGKFRLRINDWTMFESGLHKKANALRGRMTETFKVAPFFEHLQYNEGKY